MTQETFTFVRKSAGVRGSPSGDQDVGEGLRIQETPPPPPGRLPGLKSAGGPPPTALPFPPRPPRSVLLSWGSWGRFDFLLLIRLSDF